jgi:hypothetical protein
MNRRITLRVIILLGTAAFVVALCLDIYALGSGVAPQASPYAMAPMSYSAPSEGRAAFVDATYAESPARPAAKDHAGAP